jgi:nitrogen fixation protein FixH
MSTNNNSRKELIMDKLFKLLGIIFVLSLLALPLTGCDMGSGMTLNMKVDTPRDGTTVNTSTVTVRGRVAGSESAGAKVSINGADVPVKDSKFSTEVTLIEGKNVINVDATAGQAKLNEKVNVTYAPAKK